MLSSFICEQAFTSYDLANVFDYISREHTHSIKEFKPSDVIQYGACSPLYTLEIQEKCLSERDCISNSIEKNQGKSERILIREYILILVFFYLDVIIFICYNI